VSNPQTEASRQFAVDLKAFHLACGRPSLKQVSRAADGRHGPLSPATMSTMLNGKHIPKWPQVETFIRTVLELRDGVSAPNAAHEEDVSAWRRRWTEALTPAPERRQVGAQDARTWTAIPPYDRGGGSKHLPRQPALDAVVNASTEPAEPAESVERRRPHRLEMLAPQQRGFHMLLDRALNDKDADGRTWSAARFGCYAFYDIDGDLIWLGTCNEHLRMRVRRHLTGLRSDAVATGILDVREVAELELWPLWELEGVRSSDPETRRRLSALENAIYRQGIVRNRFGLPLSVPPMDSERAAQLPASRRFALLDEATFAERSHPDVRIKQYAEGLAHLSARVLERGNTSLEMRRVLANRAARLTAAAEARIAYVRGEDPVVAD